MKEIKRYTVLVAALLVALTTLAATEGSAHVQVFMTAGALEEPSRSTGTQAIGPSADPPFPAPVRPSGIDVTDGQILMVHEHSGMLYVLSLDDGSTLRTIPLPGAQQADWGSYGIVAVDGFWWHTDYQEYKLYKLDPADGAVLETRDMHFTQYLGIAWDGTNLWGVEPGAEGAVDRRRLHRIDIATGDILETIPLPHIEAPIDLTWDGAHLWVSERDGDQIHQIDREGRILSSVSTGSDGIGGIGAQKPYLWYAPRSRDPEQGVYLLHRYNLGAPPPHTLYLPIVTGSYVSSPALSRQ